MEQQTQMNFNQAIQAIKNAILQSRYRAATLVNRPSATDDLAAEQKKSFLSVCFTLHCEIIAKTKSLEECIFHIK